jgi:uncharacterized protein (DUF924 family)
MRATEVTMDFPMDFQEVLDFWFLAPASDGYGKERAAWFRKDTQFDALIAQRFGAVIAQALAGGLQAWAAAGPQGTLARILVLDQFTRNAARATPASFAGDALALADARALVDKGLDLALLPVQRWFVYMPFEHAEDAAMQERSVALFAALAPGGPAFKGALDFAQRHRRVIELFGRFPHRNAILGRPSTPDEVAFLREPGSGF